MGSTFIAAVLFCFWLLLSGHFTPLFFALGFLSTGLVMVIHRRMRHVVPYFEKTRGIFKINPIKALRYFFWLIGQIIKANLQVARIVLSPFAKIQPHMIQVPAPQKTLLGEVLFANSITLTPGTVSVETQAGSIWVHALTNESGDPEALRDMSARICAVEI